MFNMKASDFNVLGESRDTPGFYELLIKCPKELNPHDEVLYDGSLVMGYDKDSKTLHLVEFKDDDCDDDVDSYQQKFVIEGYIDSNGRESVILDFSYISESGDDRETTKIIVNFIEKTENDKETFDFIERAIIDYMI